MSKIGTKPIIITDGVEVNVDQDLIIVKGKEGTVTVPVPKGILIERQGDKLWVKREDNSKKMKSLHGLVRNLVFNATVGVTNLWEKKLEVFGTGYRVKLDGENLVFEVGFSHPVVFKKVSGITFAVEANKVSVKGVDKQLVGQVAYNIKKIKKPDVYKGKGIRYFGEKIKLRPGKKAKTVGAGTVKTV